LLDVSEFLAIITSGKLLKKFGSEFQRRRWQGMENLIQPSSWTATTLGRSSGEQGRREIFLASPPEFGASNSPPDAPQDDIHAFPPGADRAGASGFYGCHFGLAIRNGEVVVGGAPLRARIRNNS
jgi:hypothetical protein